MEEYIVELCNLVKHCNYRDLIQDRLILGILHKTLSEHLQLNPALTLEKAKQKIYQHKAVQEQQQALKGAGTNSLGNRCVTPRYKKTRRHGKAKNRLYDQRSARQRQTDFNCCSQCSKKHHPKEQ